MNELRKIMGLDEGYKVIKVEEKKNGKAVAKYIYVETTVKKYKCPKCGKYTKSIHDKLNPILLKYDLRENLLDIDEELKVVYQIKELFLDITYHATYEDVEKQLINWISLQKV